jgi:hypothetical protein
VGGEGRKKFKVYNIIGLNRIRIQLEYYKNTIELVKNDRSERIDLIFLLLDYLDVGS